MNHSKIRILIADDEADIGEILRYNLMSEGYHVDVVSSGEEALAKNPEDYDLLITDVMMGGISGYTLVERIRSEKNFNTPIIILTAKGTENDLVTGFNLGADDFISKPFSIKEVILRTRAVLRRGNKNPIITLPTDEKLISLDHERKCLLADKEEIELTPKEFGILHLLFEHIGRLFPREDILKRVWGDDVFVSDRTVDVNITRIRKKMGKYGDYLKNKTGYGYYLEIPKSNQ